MKAIEALEKAAKESKTPLGKIGKNTGKHESYFSAIKSRGSVPKCDTMAEMADVCGYCLALVPYDDLPLSAIPIDFPKRQQGTPEQA